MRVRVTCNTQREGNWRTQKNGKTDDAMPKGTKHQAPKNKTPKRLARTVCDSTPHSMACSGGEERMKV